MRIMLTASRFAVVAWIVLGQSAHAAGSITLYLNWAPGTDHAPIYFAKEQGWYEKTGIALEIQPGAGSYASVQKVAATANAAGIADLTSVLVARGSGIKVAAVMAIFSNSPHSLYWLRSSGIRSLNDMAGRTLGALSNDPTRVLWGALAKANNIPALSVTWVDVGQSAKIDALRNRTIDVATNPYLYNQAAFEQAFGSDLMQLAWRDAGLNVYGNSLIVNPQLARQKPALAKALVRTTQRAFVACIKQPAPCIDALVAANQLMSRGHELHNWQSVRDLVIPTRSDSATFGAFDPRRVQSNYEIVREYFTAVRAFEPATVVTNRFLEPNATLESLR